MENLAQLRRLGLFDTRVPRYTSYPPATRFSPGVTGQRFLDWIAALDPAQPVSLYLHVPFCRRLCWFCACRTQGVRNDNPVRAYVETLKAEIAIVAEALPAGTRIGRLHWGGGTPTLLAPDLIADLSAALHAAFDFAPDAEFSVEIDPNEFDAPRADALTAAGLTRASLGVQDFDPEIQAIIGRIQTHDVTAAAVALLRDRGIASLNADILYGLPLQTPERIARTVELLLSLAPDRVALYGYAHVPWMARRQRLIPTEALPGPEERLALFETARALFAWDGYETIGIDHFARPGDGLATARAEGRLRRNFQGYTDDTCPTLIGLGASAISRLPRGYAQNAGATADYQRAVRAGQPATARGHVFTSQDRLHGRMIEALMCDFRIGTGEMMTDFGADRKTLEDLYSRAAARFPQMTRTTRAGFEIRPEARPLTRMIARCFDEYELKPAGHSGAI